VGADGYLYEVLPDNAEFTVTPQAPERFYLFNVNAQKHKLLIFANNEPFPLRSDRVVPWAHWPSGQKVVLHGTFIPNVPRIKRMEPIWPLQDKYFNAVHYQNSAGCTLYDVWPHWHWQNPTRAWWADGGTKTIQLGFRLLFENGQIAFRLTTQGKIEIHRPKIKRFADMPPYGAVVTSLDGIPVLRLGDKSNPLRREMSFSMYVCASYPGTAIITQLIKGYRWNDYAASTTKGQWWLDASESYSDPDEGGSPYINPPTCAYLNFADAPHYFCAGSHTHVSDKFKAYVRYKPDGEDNIYVTVGRIDWGWSADTYRIQGVWSDPTYTVTEPSLDNITTDPPLWNGTYRGGLDVIP
jgi:hypothetical protein